jgi:TonB dependent receptor
VVGLDARHTIFGQWFGRQVANTFGLQVRNDWVHNGLYQTENRARVEKTDSETGTTLPATTQADRFTDTQVGFYWENQIQWAERFGTVAALRADAGHVDDTSLVNPANSGTATKVLPSPKLSLIFGPWSKTEFYVQGGFGFHSNDARGATQTVEPVSAENPYLNTPGWKPDLLLRNNERLSKEPSHDTLTTTHDRRYQLYLLNEPKFSPGSHQISSSPPSSFCISTPWRCPGRMSTSSPRTPPSQTPCRAQPRGSARLLRPHLQSQVGGRCAQRRWRLLVSVAPQHAKSRRTVRDS